MSARGNILLSTLIPSTGVVLTTSSATVASDKTFAPERDLPGGIAKWVDRSGGIALGYPSYTQQVRPPTKESRVYRVAGRLTTPVLETIDPAVGYFGPKLAYSLQAHLDVLIPERATLADKQTLFSLLVSLLATSIYASDGSPTSTTGSPLIAAVMTQEDVYG